jgi:predicted alpha-1,2-mannosidase
MLKFLGLILCLASTIGITAQSRLVNYVNPFIGTGGHGHTYPGATLPFGAVQLSPDNGTQGWDWCSGYNYIDSVIAGFSHTHLSGTGIGDLCDISLMPAIRPKADTVSYASRFSHRNEMAKPGYYAVQLKTYDVWAELTTTKHCGLHQYTFPKTNDAQIRLDLGFAINWDKPTECFVQKVNDTLYTGYRKSTGWAKNQFVAFAIALSKKPTNTQLFLEKLKTSLTQAKGKDVKACFMFTTQATEKILVKCGISYSDVDGAVAALKEIPHWNFEKVKQAAEDEWEKELRKMQVKNNSMAFLQTFYTAVYHSYLAPNVFTDANFNYSIKGDFLKNSGKAERYSVHSLWDTFRGQNPLLTLTQKERVVDIINSYLDFYDANKLLPVWDLHYNETNTMTGYHAVPVIADAMLKGLAGFNYAKAYQAMKASSMQNIRGSDAYRQFGYLPQDKHGWSATITLEYAYDDWCIAQAAKIMNETRDYDYYMQRAAYFKNIYDSQTGFFRAKDSKGKFLPNFDAYYSEHGFDGQYIEGTAWQHTFFVPHAPLAMMELMGGREKFIAKLDTLFSTISKMNGENVSSDISGMIGQYAHGNEPSHHIAYLYNYAGQPWKTAEKVRKICNTMYSNQPQGLCGNEDCGQLSAWYVWSALGFYPMNPASGQYVIGSPLVNEAIITMDNGILLRLVVKNNSEKNIYIQKITYNNQPYNLNYFRHSDFVRGGYIEITMGNKPNKLWASNKAATGYSME